MKRFEAAFNRLLDACGAISATLAFGVTVMIMSNVILRNAVGGRVPGDVELSEYVMLLMTVTAAPWLLHQGQHVRIDLMLQKIPRTLGWACELFVDALGFVVCVLMGVYSVRVLLTSYGSGVNIVKEFTIPEWWTFWPMPIMFVLLTIEFVLRFRRVWTGPRQIRAEGASI